MTRKNKLSEQKNVLALIINFPETRNKMKYEAKAPTSINRAPETFRAFEKSFFLTANNSAESKLSTALKAAAP